MASYSGKHGKNTAWKWIFYNFRFGLNSSHGFMNQVFFSDELRCLSALLCIARIPDFKRVVLPGALGALGRLWGWRLVAHFWSEIFLLWKVLKLASEFGILWVSSIFGLKEESNNRGFAFLIIHRTQFGANCLRSQTAHCWWTPGTGSFGFADGWHQCESEYGGAIVNVGDEQIRFATLNRIVGLQVFFCRYLATDYNRKNQITTSSFRIAHNAGLIRCTSKFQLSPHVEMLAGARWTFLPDCCFTVLWMWLEVLF